MSLIDKKNIKNLAARLGADAFGVSDFTPFPSREWTVKLPSYVDRFTRAVSLAVRLSDSVLDQIAFRLSQFLQANGYRSLGV